MILSAVICVYLTRGDVSAKVIPVVFAVSHCQPCGKIDYSRLGKPARALEALDRVECRRGEGGAVGAEQTNVGINDLHADILARKLVSARGQVYLVGQDGIIGITAVYHSFARAAVPAVARHRTRGIDIGGNGFDPLAPHVVTKRGDDLGVSLAASLAAKGLYTLRIAFSRGGDPAAVP